MRKHVAQSTVPVSVPTVEVQTNRNLHFSLNECQSYAYIRFSIPSLLSETIGWKWIRGRTFLKKERAEVFPGGPSQKTNFLPSNVWRYVFLQRNMGYISL